MSFNQELQEDLINSSILRSAFFNYFFRIFNNVADESFIGVSSKYLSYFNDLKEYVESDEYNNAYKLFEEYVNEEDKAEKMMEDPRLIRTPIVRNGKKATVGYQPDVWKTWE